MLMSANAGSASGIPMWFATRLVVAARLAHRQVVRQSCLAVLQP